MFSFLGFLVHFIPVDFEYGFVETDVKEEFRQSAAKIDTGASNFSSVNLKATDDLLKKNDEGDQTKTEDV